MSSVPLMEMRIQRKAIPSLSNRAYT